MYCPCIGTALLLPYRGGEGKKGTWTDGIKFSLVYRIDKQLIGPNECHNFFKDAKQDPKQLRVHVSDMIKP